MRSDSLPGAWAENAETTIPENPLVGTTYRDPSLSTTATNEAWPFSQVVSSKDFNQFLYLMSKIMIETEHKGILGWSNKIDYHTGAWVTVDSGGTYISLTTPNINKNPTSQPSYWKEASVSISEADLARSAANGMAYSDSGEANVYKLSRGGDQITSYRDGDMFRFVPDNNNTGASTVSVSGLPAKPIKKNGFTENLESGDIIASEVYEIYYNSFSDVFQLFKPALEESVTSGSNTMAVFEDRRASGNPGGTFTAGSWQTRVLNTVASNDIPGASLSSNRITLQTGKYHFSIKAVALDVQNHKIRLRNITNGNTELVGLSNDLTSSTDISGVAICEGVLTITSQKVFEIQHRCSTTQNTDGFGSPSSFGDNEVYCTCTVKKVG